MPRRHPDHRGGDPQRSKRMRELAERVGLDIKLLKTIPKVSDIRPVGLCYAASPKGRHQYRTESDAEQALRHVQWKRIFECADEIEVRYYLHDTEHGGCGFYHLSSQPLDEMEPQNV